MVNSIRGTLTYKTPESVGVETGGIEWAMDTTATTLSNLPSVGHEVRVFTHLHHTQDAMKLYGFATAEEREAFHALLTVSGVGPSLAGIGTLAASRVAGTSAADYLRESITDPNSFVVDGYNSGVMPSGWDLSDAQIDSLVEYLLDL